MPYSSFVKFSWLQKSYDEKTLWKSGFAFLPYHYHGNCYIFPWWKYWSLDLELLFALYFSVQFFPLVNSWSIHIDYNYEIACIQSFQTFQSLQALISLISIFTFFACVVWCISTDLLLWSFTQKNHFISRKFPKFSNLFWMLVQKSRLKTIADIILRFSRILISYSKIGF